MNDLLAGLAGAGCVTALITLAFLPFIMQAVQHTWEWWNAILDWTLDAWIAAWRDVIARWRGPQ